VPDLAEMHVLLRERQQRLSLLMGRRLQQHQAQIGQLRRALSHLSPRTRLENNRQRVDGLHGRLAQAMSRRLEKQQARLALARTALLAVGPAATLQRGYAIVRRADGRIVRSVTAVAPGDLIQVQVQDGRFTAETVAQIDDEQYI
jgi:exodeoxyribonuclease VII large subunit